MTTKIVQTEKSKDRKPNRNMSVPESANHDATNDPNKAPECKLENNANHNEPCVGKAEEIQNAFDKMHIQLQVD